MDSEVVRVRAMVREAKAITILTGAGISTDSGIPDFRGPNGVWTKNPDAEKMSTLSHYVADPDVRRMAWRSRREHPAWTAEPNAAHRALADLEASGRLLAIVTQNIDGLHQKAGSDPSRVIEIHGTVHEAACLSCDRRIPMSDALARVSAGDDDPVCVECGDILKSATISFGQALVPAVLEAAAEAAALCDVFLAIGSSLTVRPAAGLCELAVDHGARLVIVNEQPTPYDGIASAILSDPIGTVLPALVADLSRA